MYTILLVIHSIIVLFLIGMILIQRTDSDGMGGLGGGGGNQFLTGRAQANLLTRTTAILAAAFFATSLTLAIIASRLTTASIVDSAPIQHSIPLENKPTENAPEVTKSQILEKTPAPAAPATPAPAVPKPE